jgi:hypothetical protein
MRDSLVDIHWELTGSEDYKVLSVGLVYWLLVAGSLLVVVRCSLFGLRSSVFGLSILSIEHNPLIYLYPFFNNLIPLVSVSKSQSLIVTHSLSL